MGAGIAHVVAQARLSVVVIASSSPGSVDRARQRVVSSVDRAVRSGKIGEGERRGILGRVSFTTDLSEAAAQDLVLEAVPEDLDAKLEIFELLDELIERPDAILASTTSSIPIAKLGKVTRRPGRVVGVHFFNPAPVLQLVELVGSVLTYPDVVARAEQFLGATLGKEVVRAPDRAGFIVNALLMPYILSAIRMVESGVATARAIDDAMKFGCAHPMGPLALADLIGLDTVAGIAESMYAEVPGPQHVVPSSLARMIEARFLGKKTGRGFYHYDSNGRSFAG